MNTQVARNNFCFALFWLLCYPQLSGISKTSDGHLHHISVDKQLLPKKRKREREAENKFWTKGKDPPPYTHTALVLRYVCLNFLLVPLHCLLFTLLRFPGMRSPFLSTSSLKHRLLLEPTTTDVLALFRQLLSFTASPCKVVICI